MCAHGGKAGAHTINMMSSRVCFTPFLVAVTAALHMRRKESSQHSLCPIVNRAQVELEGSSAEVTAEAGPLRLQPGAPANALVVRKPELRIDSDWTLRFHQ